MGYEKGEQMPQKESGIDNLSNKICGYGDVLLEEASHGELKELMKAWAPDFDPASCETHAELLTAIAEVLAPIKGRGTPRWELIEQEQRDCTDSQRHLVFELADRFSLRLSENSITDDELSLADVSGIDITLIAEGGANKTSIVRRGLLLDLCERKVLSSNRIYQMGGGRTISKTREDGSDNPEYKVAREISGDYFPKDEQDKDKESITEFDLNVASALNQGWEVHQHSRHSVDQVPEYFEQDVILSRPDFDKPSIWALQPKEGTLKNGVASLIKSGIDPLSDNNRQHLIVATNGQYRPKSEIQVAIACLATGFEPKKIIAIGDETGQRDEKVYAREIGALAQEIVNFDQALKENRRSPIL